MSAETKAPETYSVEWFEECFTNPVTREPYPIPEDLKRAATRVTLAYRIGGVCDPMYIANVFAWETGQGDGQSHFTREAWLERHHQEQRHSGTSGAVMCPICAAIK